MNWPGQVLHVAAKDARMLRWFGLAYAALVVLAGTQARGTTFYTTPLLVLAGVAAVALVVQADSPLRSDAFWASRPLSPGAVLTAKVVVVGALVLLALAGQVLVLVRHAVDAAEYPADLAEGGFGYAALLGTGLAVGAVTRDLRGFGFGWILAVIGALAGGAVLEAWLAHAASLPAGWFGVLVLGGCLAVAAAQYRLARRWVSLALLGLVWLGAVLLNPLFRAGFAEADSSAPLPASLRPTSLAAEFLAPPGQPAAASSLRISLSGGAPGYEYVLAHVSAVLRTQGAERTQSMPSWTLPPLSTAYPLVPGTTWAGGAQAESERQGVTVRDWHVLPGAVPVLLRGRLEAWRGRIAARLPLEVGRSVVKSGRDIRIVGLSNGDRGLELRLQTSFAGRAARNSLGYGQRLDYALLDRVHHVIYPLGQGSRSGGNNAVLVPVEDYAIRLTPRGETAPPLPAAGAGALELLLVEWRVVGSYPVSLPVQDRTGAQAADSASAGQEAQP